MDIFTKVLENGLSDIYTGHSFTNTYIFIPQLCFICNNYMYILTENVICLRCNLTAHRKCIDNVNTCQK